MAYTSRKWQKGWACGAGADDFDARIGRIICGGIESRGENVRTPATAAASRPQTERAKTAAENASTATAKASTSSPDVSVVVVDERGRLVNQARTSSRCNSQHNESDSKGELCGEDDAGLGRSMRLWSKIMPAYLPQCHASPLSTTHSNFQWHPELMDRKSDRHHLKKTDFSEYNEVSLRLMKHLK